MSSIISERNFKISLAASLTILYGLLFLWLNFYQLNTVSSNLFCALSTILFGLSVILIGNNLNFYRPANFNYSYLLVWCLVYAWFSTFFPNWLLLLYSKNDKPFSTFIENSTYVRLIFNFLALLCFSAFSLIWYNIGDNKENNKRKEEALALNRESELYKLRQQLQPHFLFNSLNSINALIGSKPTAARKMIEQLSDFLRYTIKKEENQLVELKDELQHLQLYLEIEKVRFGHRLITNFEVEESTLTQKIPALLLQPIMENAIKFGLYDTIEQVKINLNAKKELNNLVLEIKNPFDKLTSINSKGTGFGLRSVRKRLQLLFFRNDLLKTSTIENTFITEITIPQTIIKT